MKKKEESKTKGNEDAAKVLAEKRRLQCHVVLQSKQGINVGKKRSRMDDDHHKSDDKTMSTYEAEDCMEYELPLKEIEAKRDLNILMKTVEKKSVVIEAIYLIYDSIYTSEIFHSIILNIILIDTLY
ncbi:hypothetical protein INT47_008977 [Mucor saturninus]|uniref:Uncharacterized protein n=1 Tax=Mucor saturninus TaxID=64648 RepID=A0A8H7R2Z1_9FUNG|nr:hypothetical protein INT47_008977 [Mucor saturninus]